MFPCLFLPHPSQNVRSFSTECFNRTERPLRFTTVFGCRTVQIVLDSQELTRWSKSCIFRAEMRTKSHQHLPQNHIGIQSILNLLWNYHGYNDHRTSTRNSHLWFVKVIRSRYDFKDFNSYSSVFRQSNPGRWLAAWRYADLSNKSVYHVINSKM